MTENKTLKLVKYGHEFCGPCKTIKPILEDVAQSFSNSLEFVDKNALTLTMDELTTANIKAVPTMILYKNDAEIWRHVGLISKDAIEQKIKENL